MIKNIYRRFFPLRITDAFRLGDWTRYLQEDNSALGDLAATLPTLILKSKSDSTFKNYNSNFKQWCKWCSDYGVSPLPSTGYYVSLYINHLVRKGCGASKLDQTIYSIKWAHEIAGFSNPCDSFLVRSSIQGAKRLLGRQSIPKEPISPNILQSMVKHFGQNSNLYDKRTVAMCVTAYSGFLRFSELVNLKCSDIEFHDQYMTLFIEKSKTDQLREGRRIFIAKLDSIACPVQILKDYMSLAKLDTSNSGFLFRQLSFCKKTSTYQLRKVGKLSYTRVRELLLEKLVFLGLDPTVFGLHSLRSGGATAAANAGISDRLFKKHGRWKSDKAKDGYHGPDMHVSGTQPSAPEFCTMSSANIGLSLESDDPNYVIYCNESEGWNNSCGYPNLTESSEKSSNNVWTADVIQRVVTIVIIMILTLIGNSMIIILLSFGRNRKSNRVNIFIVNLAIGDLAVCIVTMTTEILFVAFGEWVLGAAMCKILTYLEIVTLASATFLLTSMSLERYIAICQPLRFKTSKHRAKLMILTSWIMAFIFAVPQIFIFVQTEDKVDEDGKTIYGCRSRGYSAEWQRKVYFTFLTSYILFIPTVIMSFCYINVALAIKNQGKVLHQRQNQNFNSWHKSSNFISRAKVKTIKFTSCIVILFVTCWSPYFITTLIRIYSDYKYKIPKHVMVFAETAALFQSAVNPILYSIFNLQIQRDLKGVCCKKQSTNQSRAILQYLGKAEENYCRQCKHLMCAGNSSSSSSHRNASKYQEMFIADTRDNGIKLKVRFVPKSNTATSL
ncbi:hypothetical protein FSP39_000719 [Pinctada imbricata]|uniref:Uncharacterized protein n=1 Tax=Pinctada imbricata TaxID=66713 RepID=A0AA88YLW0_PINIB|nr:hypothetical protein FSP39_000719 [Pinctada imbricata]